MDIQFQKSAFDDYQQWSVDDKKIFAKISGLLKEIMRTPFTGTGKPEPLKGNLFWFLVSDIQMSIVLFIKSKRILYILLVVNSIIKLINPCFVKNRGCLLAPELRHNTVEINQKL